MNNNNTKVEAVLTKPSKSKNRIIEIMKPEVKNMEITGVPRLEIFEKKDGRSRSLLIAIG